MVKKYVILCLTALLIIGYVVIRLTISKSNEISYTYNPRSWASEKIENDYYNYIDYYQNLGAVNVELPEPIIIAGASYKEATFEFGDSNEKIENPLLGYLIDKESSIEYSDALEDVLLYTPEVGTITWQVKIPASGFYNIYLRYYPIQGKSSGIERSLQINGRTPFDGANNFLFNRIWGNNPESLEEGSFKQDVQGNDIKPQQTETPSFRYSSFRDNLGYVREPYRFYFEANDEEDFNEISLTAIKENLMIDQIILCEVEETPSYEEYLENLVDKNEISATSTSIRIEAESAIAKSSPTLYPITDRSSSNTYPYSPSTTKLNAIGGSNWKVLGDWIKWEFEVPSDGFYQISLRARQNEVRGLYSNRIVYLDDEVLFKELNTTLFAYSSDWQNVTLGSKDKPFEFFLTKGRHTLTFEVTLGEYSSLIERIQAVIDQLNQLYRDIIKFTSPAPDPNRDYQLTEREGLNMLDRMDEARVELESISSAIQTISGTKSDKTGIIDTVVVQLRDFIDQPRKVPARLKTFSNNISALGTLLGTLREYPLTIDYLLIHTPDISLPKANEGFFKKTWSAIQSFWYSFFIDYSSISLTESMDSDTSIEVWMTLGRDQAIVIRDLIDESFTPVTGIKVDLKLTGLDVLLKATLAGIGPNVAINVQSNLPVNYGLRNAVMDLREFPDYESVIERNSKMTDEEFSLLPQALQQWRFKMSALRQFQFNGAAYALPEKDIFLMMFVREDIFSELGLKVPETWDEVISLVADLQANQLQFYMPVNEPGAFILNPSFVSILYQMGGNLYQNDNMETGLFSENALDAFEYWTEFYTLYSFPTYANFLNRFRSGEMPIGIAYYELYNTLSVFAPDLRGKWAFYPIPGIEKHTYDDEGNITSTYIDNTSPSIGTGCVILKQPALNDPKAKDASWEFLKWWTSANTQVRFGREMEGILGSAARHATANVVALEQLAWPSADYKQLSYQWNHVREIPNVAGSYITGREVENAYRVVINDLVNAKETIYEYAQNIQNEIDRKRKEFDLPLASGG